HVLEVRRLGIVLGEARCRQVVRRDEPPDARRIGLPGAEGIFSGHYLLGGGGAEQKQAKREGGKNGRGTHGVLQSAARMRRDLRQRPRRAMVPARAARPRPTASENGGP